jgi:uncharacterized protein YecT (DUF1311 family)
MKIPASMIAALKSYGQHRSFGLVELSNFCSKYSWRLFFVCIVFQTCALARADDSPCAALSPDASKSCKLLADAQIALKGTFDQVLVNAVARFSEKAEVMDMKIALMQSQKEWQRFSDADCKAVGQLFHGGTGALSSELACSARQADERRRQLVEEFMPQR